MGDSFILISSRKAPTDCIQMTPSSHKQQGANAGVRQQLEEKNEDPSVAEAVNVEAISRRLRVAEANISIICFVLSDAFELFFSQRDFFHSGLLFLQWALLS